MPHNMWDLSSPTWDQTQSPALEGRFLTTGPPGRSPLFILIIEATSQNMSISIPKQRASRGPCLRSQTAGPSPSLKHREGRIGPAARFASAPAAGVIMFTCIIMCVSACAPLFLLADWSPCAVSPGSGAGRCWGQEACDSDRDLAGCGMSQG